MTNKFFIIALVTGSIACFSSIIILASKAQSADQWQAAALERTTSPMPTNLLVGYGCDGASGPLYAAEEDHFPPCAIIEPLASRQ